MNVLKNGLYDFDKIMMPFWQSDIMYNESVLMLLEDLKPAEAKLLFRPLEILSVRNSYLDTEYIEGEDWVFENGLLKLTEKSRAAFMTSEELYPAEASQGWTFPKTGGGNILFQEGHFYHDKQLAVTYLHSQDDWAGPFPAFAGEKLGGTLTALRKRGRLKLVLYGDSISAGANSSGRTGAPPYQPMWGNLFAEKLRRHYGAEVEFINPSVGGKASNWGLENVEALVSKHMPDLITLAFGMNDGTGRVAPDDFKDNIQAMMDNVHKYNPAAEFILVAPMLPNKLAALPGRPDVSYWGEQENYREVLEQLSGEGVAMADMTTVHKELLKHKKYCDMTGNNVNHPNDFLSRWYAQVISALLIEG